ncbi:MAG: hypothetical protein LW832_04880 [Parachlamydia sp.]|jgi:hypothetical protein|nr:hypothetical protein [Parachlamydia sp.]
MNKRKLLLRILCLCLFAAALYGAGRLYFKLTGGFKLKHVQSDFAYNPEWEVRPLVKEEQEVVEAALNQPYRYLGKGCQSYVFASEDGNYVLKFFKYQRYRLQPWLLYTPTLPALEAYKNEKLAKKWHKLDGFVKSWKLAFEKLKKETGLVFVHLNKTNNLQKELVFYDKIGMRHAVNLDDMEFCVQDQARMLCDVLLSYKAEGRLAEGRELIDRLLALLLSEYDRGLADNDHALMQNTGVVDGRPIHIDVGQFVENEEVKKPSIYHQELFTKTYKFKLWLQENDPHIADHLEARLKEIMGQAYSSMQPKFRQK